MQECGRRIEQSNDALDGVATASTPNAPLPLPLTLAKRDPKYILIVFTRQPSVKAARRVAATLGNVRQMVRRPEGPRQF
mgnify:CR=1 FL=1